MEHMICLVLVADARVSNGAKNLTQGCPVEFINIVADEAAKCCNQDECTMMTPDDITYALRSLRLHRFIESMGTYLRRYHEAAATSTTK
ncbi:hypothetical protein PR202_gb09623 [Eleusine coracana subsp. coracana]|uniref:Transcription factor CBF/NF-Y/archaeal histone domain-containing protein n=1 Tax=Eleusine coracana subsp. coracana TaxID=191504 RepID=A0AAV5EII0_ELECO|nr:hypothetical protein PR202_gb09623 [Eleusine coracana subsp. coracana]